MVGSYRFLLMVAIVEIKKQYAIKHTTRLDLTWRRLGLETN